MGLGTLRAAFVTALSVLSGVPCNSTMSGAQRLEKAVTEPTALLLVGGMLVMVSRLRRK